MRGFVNGESVGEIAGVRGKGVTPMLGEGEIFRHHS